MNCIGHRDSCKTRFRVARSPATAVTPEETRLYLIPCRRDALPRVRVLPALTYGRAELRTNRNARCFAAHALPHRIEVLKGLRNVLTMVVLWLVFAAPVEAMGKSILLTEDVQLKLGDSFMAENEYYRAVTEYRKFIILFPDSDQADSVWFKIGHACYQGEEFEMAARAFACFGEKYPASKYSPAAGYQAGLCFWRMDRLDEAATSFASVATSYPISTEARRSLLEAALVEFDRKNIPESRRMLERFLDAYPDDGLTVKARSAINLMDREIPRKSPAAAGILSAVVPGAGHVYAGHYVDGISSFFLNGLLITGTIAAVRHEEYAVAAVVGTISVPFYIGNIYGAANAANKWNISVRRDLRGTIGVTLGSPF